MDLKCQHLLDRAIGTEITIDVNGTTASGATLEADISTTDVTTITSLKIAAGQVTIEDWKYLKTLTALTSFEILASVGTVDDIPNTNFLFPKTIQAVIVPQAIAIGIVLFMDALYLKL